MKGAPRVGSLFSGIGGFDLGLQRAGFEVAWQVEYDKQARSVLRRHWPDVDLYEDVRDVGRSTLAPVDLICGGFPCQDVSVAGKRAGLDGERSGLWWEFHRIIGELAPTWVLIENVPGLLSGCGCVTCEAVKRIRRIHAWVRRRKGGVTCDLCHAGERLLASHAGRNMAIVVQGLAELGYGWTYRVLDSQYFDVAQRRERVFIIGRAGGFCPPEILFESESVFRDSAPSRSEGEGDTTGLARSLRGQSNASHREDSDTYVARALTSREGKGPNSDCDSGNVVANTLRDGGRGQGAGDGPDNTPIVADTLVAGGREIPPHGVGDGKNLVASPLTASFAKNHGMQAGKDSTPRNIVYRKAQKAHDPDDHERWEEAESSNTLNGQGDTAGVVPLTYALRSDAGREGKAKTPSRDAEGNVRLRDPGFTVEVERSPTIDANQPHTVIPQSLAVRGRPDGRNVEVGKDGLANALFTPNGGRDGMGSGAIVAAVPRRLTPTECERLQGFPDGWTEWGVTDGDGWPVLEKTQIADGPRYRMMGNAVTVDVPEWIGLRLMRYLSHKLGSFDDKEVTE